MVLFANGILKDRYFHVVARLHHHKLSYSADCYKLGGGENFVPLLIQFSFYFLLWNKILASLR